MEKQVKTSREWVEAELAKRRGALRSLELEIAELEQVLSSFDLFEKYGLVSEPTAIYNPEQKRSRENDSQILIQILKDAGDELLTTSEIVERYAQILDTPTFFVRAFVDSTLSRLTANGTLIKAPNPRGRGSIYLYAGSDSNEKSRLGLVS